MMSPAEGEYILLVEDSDVDFDILISVVADLKRNIKIFREVSGENTLVFLSQIVEDGSRLPSLILMDLNLLGMNGIELVRQIRSRNALKRIPLVILSTSISQVDVDAAYSAGANAYIAKPLKLEKFEIVIENVLDYWYMSCLLPSSKIATIPAARI